MRLRSGESVRDNYGNLFVAGGRARLVARLTHHDGRCSESTLGALAQGIACKNKKIEARSMPLRLSYACRAQIHGYG